MNQERRSVLQALLAVLGGLIFGVKRTEAEAEVKPGESRWPLYLFKGTPTRLFRAVPNPDYPSMGPPTTRVEIRWDEVIPGEELLAVGIAASEVLHEGATRLYCFEKWRVGPRGYTGQRDHNGQETPSIHVTHEIDLLNGETEWKSSYPSGAAVDPA